MIGVAADSDLNRSIGRQAGRVHFFPDILPLPDPRDLRRLLQGAASDQGPAVLQKWRKLTDTGNTGRSDLEYSCKLTRMAHLWRVLMARFPKPHHGSTGQLKKAMAMHMGVSPDTLKRWFGELNRLLGSDWEDRPLPDIGSPACEPTT